MHLAYSPYSFPLLAASILSAGVAIYIWSRRHVAGAVPLALIATIIAFWSLGYAFEIMVRDLPGKIFLGKSQYIGITFSPYLWLWFAVAYTHQEQTRPWRALRWLALLPLITTLLVFTTDWHGLVWREMSILQNDNFTVLGVTYGPWFWFHFTTSYLFMLAGTVIIVRGLWRMQGLYRAQIISILVAILSPWISNFLYFADLNPVPGLDLTPFAFTVTVLGLTWGILGYRLLNIVPIARDLVVEGMQEGVLVINEQGYIADINPAAARLIGLPASQAIGQRAGDALAPWPHLRDHLQGAAEAQDEIVIGQGEAQVRYGVRIAPLYDRQQRPIGHIITTRKRQETATPTQPFIARVEPKSPVLRQATAVPHLAPSTPAWNYPLVRAIVSYFVPPLKEDVDVIIGESPLLSQLLERSFTAMLRFATTLGVVALLIVWRPLLNAAAATQLLGFIIGFGCLVILSAIRRIKFAYRARVFLLVLYAIAVLELASYGYSIETFIFFISLTTLSVLLQGTRTGVIVAGVSISTLAIFGWQILRGSYQPLAIPMETAPPTTFEFGLAGLIVFAASTVTLLITITVLLQSVNKAWQQETQARNLLQQERDALDRRITERTQQLQESEANLRSFIESSPASILQVDPAYKLIFAHVPGLTETEAQSILGLSLLDLVIEEDRETIRATLQQLFQGQRRDVQYEASGFDQRLGQVRAYITHVAPIMDGGRIGSALLISTDITERKQIELALKQAEEQRQAMLDAIPDLVFRIQTDGVFLDYYGASSELLLIRPEEFIGHTLQETLPPYLATQLSAAIAQTVATGQLTKIEYSLQLSPGAPMEFEGRIVPINATEVLALVRDITERKKTEAALQVYAEQLAIARDQALEASQHKSMLLRKVSHELRTPLAGILGYAELLDEEIAGALLPKQAAFVRQIMQSSQHLNWLITDLLDQSQIEQGLLKIIKQPIVLSSMVSFLENLLQPLASGKGLQLTFHCSPTMPDIIMGDERRLRQIIINLANNAIKFTATGFIKVTIEPAEAQGWHIQVRDTGMGIASESQSKIFDSFWQADSSASSPHTGYGLGLSIVHHLVELMDGRIDLESEDGSGSVFTVWLPLDPLKTLKQTEVLQ